ncbi:MAG TPA: putative toxin-antitoxin system toxin component, PIN family [Bryobacteraceae bacterium]|nr:putative toxin-antitoxin system toxin component, PIN family [Bryobacteraceae bacterium]
MSAARPGAQLKAVLDTNVYVSAFHSMRGAPFELWRSAIRRKYLLLVSPAIIGELASVLRADLAWPEEEIVAQLKLVVRVASMVQPTFTLEVIARDRDDDRILECAVAGKADLIVSGDRHLTRLKTFQSIAIVRPADFLRMMQH